jgi:hypothetical protein
LIRDTTEKGLIVRLEPTDTRLVSTRVPNELYRALAADAATLGTSVAAVTRLYLKMKAGQLPDLNNVGVLR